MDHTSKEQQKTRTESTRRLRVFYGLLVAVFAVFAVRLFYLQIIRHEHYVQAAHSDQFREYDVIPNRGKISAYLNGAVVPLVVNQRLYTIYADPQIIKKPDVMAEKLAPLLDMTVSDVRQKLAAKKMRYVVLKKKVAPTTSAKILALKLPGVGAQEKNYRLYPQGTIAAQTLGFVSEEGEGKYGLEEALNTELTGRVGKLKAVTDIHGIPLAANADNLSVAPEDGADVVTTLDIGMQTQIEDILKRAKERFSSKSISAVVLESKTGAVKALANYPSFDPAQYQSVEDGALFQNYAVATPIEPGSITKILSAAAALDKGVIQPNSSFYDPGRWVIDGATIRDVEEDASIGTQTIKSTLSDSLNTGAVWMLMQLGGGSLNQKGRAALYEYYKNHYRLNARTGIEQGYEGVGLLKEPADDGAGINISYANMAFGQAYTATALQMAAAINSIVNGGTYYRPTLVSSVAENGRPVQRRPEVLRQGVVSAETSRAMVALMDYVTAVRAQRGVKNMVFGSNYSVGSKSGTAQIAKETGGYREDVFNGTFAGYVGGNNPEYTVVVYNIEPRVPAGSYAGSYAGQPVFAEIAHMLINNYGVPPKQ